MALWNPQISSVCLNDTPRCNDEEYVLLNGSLIEMLEKKFSDKSSFEI